MCTVRERLAGIGDRRHETEVRKAGTRRAVIGHEDIRLLHVKNGTVAKRRGTDAFEATVCKTDAVEIFQTLGCPIQLSSHFSKGSGGEKGMPRTNSSLLA